MTLKLTEELRHALAQEPGRPLEVEDPVTHQRYVLLRQEVYERLQQALDYDASEPDPRDFYPAFAKAVQVDLDAPVMEHPEEGASHPTEP